MTYQERAEQVIKEQGGVARTVELLSAGVHKLEITALCEEGKLVRVRHGYYQLPGAQAVPQILFLTKLIPEGILCMESALWHYGYSEAPSPRFIISVPRTISRTRLKSDDPPVRAYYVPRALHALGKTTALIDGVRASIYDRERTICDCARFHTKLSERQLHVALRTYAADPLRDPRRLLEYLHAMNLGRNAFSLLSKANLLPKNEV